jgi:hypothetical protein
MSSRGEGGIASGRRAPSSGSTLRHPHPRVLLTRDERDLDRVREPGVSAVVYTQLARPGWLDELATAVETERLRLPRTVLDDVVPADVAAWMDHTLPVGVLTTATREALADDVRWLAERTRQVAGADRCMVRILTATPTPQCGFHLDTVAAGGRPWGLLRVYNGAGTTYVDPTAVTGMRDFYRYLGRRERLVRELHAARGSGDEDDAVRIESERDELDSRLRFVTDPAGIGLVPAGSVVAFTHLDAGRLWSDHPPGLAWIHCSPMAGVPRLVVNVTPRGRHRSAGARAGHGTAP